MISACLLGAALPAWADPTWGDSFSFEQPDGAAVTVRIWGDEFYRVVESEDGYTLTRDPQSGAICYAELADDRQSLVSTGFRVDQVDGAALGLAKHLRITTAAAKAQAQAVIDQKLAAERAELELFYSKSVILSAPAAATTGDVLGILLLIDFSDAPATIPASAVEAYANQVGYSGYGNNGSVHDYFADASGGLLNYTNWVPTAWYRASQPKSYYDDCDAPYGTRARELIREALNALNSQGMDFSQFDSNGDGLIDAINCFYAGTTSCPWAQGLWPHSSSALSFSADGVSSWKYQITGIGNSLTLSTFCHENGHMLCLWPDLYDYDYSSNGVGKFCLMCSYASSTNPQQPSAYMKQLAGWANIVDLTEFTPDLPLPADATNTIYRYREGYSDYYLIENRQKTGRDLYLPDAGMAIWHCDPNGDNDNEDQTAALHYEVTLVQADGRWDLENNVNNGDSTDLWGGSQYAEFTPETDPAASWWYGGSCNLYVLDISASAATMTFTFNPQGAVNVPGQYATIQAAIDASNNGQVILLADGVYTGSGNRDLDFGGKLLEIRSVSGDPARCVIDCQGAAGDEHRGFWLHGGETAVAEIAGLTIRGGYAATGGGMLLDGAAPTLDNVVFEDCTATASGGGLEIVGSGAVIRDCLFSGNAAPRGGALFVDGDATVDGGTFWANAAPAGGVLETAVGSTLTVTRSLLAGATAGAAAVGTVDAECCDVYANAGGDWSAALAGQEAALGNFSLDPLFCDAAAGDLTLRENSPCAPGWHPDGIAPCGEVAIGARGVGCLAEMFTPVTTGPTAVDGDSYGAAWGDYDRDGDPDLYVVNYNGPDVLLRNDGDGVFSDVTAAPLGDSGPGTGAAWGDYDNDGDPDLYLTRRDAADMLYRNDDGVFVEANGYTLGDTGPGSGVSWTDYDGDGRLDVYVTRSGAANLLYRNYGDIGGGSWLFVVVSGSVVLDPGTSNGAAWGDYDGDGDSDLYIVNEGPNKLIQNFGALGFSDETGYGSLANSNTGFGAVWGDYDNSGSLDLYLVNGGQADVLLNNTGGSFSLVTGGPLGDTGRGRGAAWGDFDNDGRLDLMLARSGQPASLLWNKGLGQFGTLAVPQGEGLSRAVACADVDGDGDLDAYLTRDGVNLLLLNQFNNGYHWLEVDLEGTDSNRDAVGAQVRLYAGGSVQLRELQAGGGYLAQNEGRCGFGLGLSATVDSLVVRWPSGLVEVRTALAADQLVSLTEGEKPSGVDGPDLPAAFVLHGNAPNPFNPTTTISYELGAAARVDLTVYDLRGRQIRQLVNGSNEAAGPHAVVWDGRDDRGRGLASGVYFYRLAAGTYQATRRMVLIK